MPLDLARIEHETAGCARACSEEAAPRDVQLGEKFRLARTWRLYGNPENALDGWLGNLNARQLSAGKQAASFRSLQFHSISKVALGGVLAAGGRAGGLETGKAENDSLFCLICAKKINIAAHLPII